MTQTIQKQEEHKKHKKPSRFDNVFADAIYNVIVWLPVSIMSWIASQFDF